MKAIFAIFFMGMLCTCSDQRQEVPSSSSSSPIGDKANSVNPQIQAAPLPVGPAPAASVGVKEPLLSEYRSLDGDHGHDRRITELLSDAKSHKYEALLGLGMADIEKEALIQRIKQEITWGPEDEGFRFLIACLAKLGDEQSYDLIISHLHTGNYVQQEAAVDSLAYIGDKRSYLVLRKGLDDSGCLRQPFNPKEIEEPESALAPPMRFSCLRVLDTAFPGSGIPDEAESWTQKDIDRFKSFYDNQQGRDQ